MDKKVIVRQNGYKDCGPACLLSIMRYYNCDVSLDELSYILKTNNEGTNAYNIINGARSFGFDGYGYHYTYEEIISNNVSFPIICHVNKDNMFHFIVVYGIKKNYLIVMDPSSDIYKISKEQFKKIYLSSSLIIYPVKKFDNISNHKILFNFISYYIFLEKNKSFKTIILSIFVIFLSIILNYYVLICLDIILPNYKYNLLIKISIIFGIFYIIKNILNYIKNKYIFDIEQSISININQDIINKLFNLPYQFFKNKSTGEVIQRVNDIKLFKDVLIEIISNISTNILLVIISMIVLLIINVRLFLINFISMIIYYLIMIVYKDIFVKQTQNILEKESLYNKVLNENICGYESIKNINMINNSLEKIKFNYNLYINKYKLYECTLNNQLFLKDIIMSISYILTIFMGIVFINNKILSIGEFYLFNSILLYFTEPLKNILDLYPNINYIKNIYNRINDLLIINKKEEGEIVDNFKGDIFIDNISYSHDGINNIFENVSFNIKYGSKFLIYGKSGNGKSTIVKILLKYLTDYRGKIYIGNVNLKDISEESISNNMTYVSQHSYVYNDTLMNNIVMNRRVDYKEYEKVLKICNLESLRDSKPLRNNFMIEDDGFNISGGERQKIVLARSLLKNSNYIILDEALSEVGVKEEKEIINNIFCNFKNKTIIYISHKKEIIDMFDLKYKLERRRVNDK